MGTRLSFAPGMKETPHTMTPRHRAWMAITVTLVALTLWGCSGDKLYLGADARVAFSQDTVLFDTVFSTIGSASEAFRIVNDSPGRILLEDITLEDGEDSPFRINVDGLPGPSVGGLELGEGDSLYVFVEVTIDPQNDYDLPFIVKDRIRVTVNGFSQYVQLLAWGQDAFFHGSPGGISTLDCNALWTAQKPHVIYGVVGVAPGCNLTIEAGADVHVHSGGGLYVSGGTLDVNGELGNPVVFEGDRLEPEYADVPGQWGIQVDTLIQTEIGVAQASILGGGIWIYGSPGSTLRHTILRNGTIGLQVDTTGTEGAAVTLENCVIHNMSAIGLLAQGAHIDGTNNLLYDCGQACAAFTLGGRYRFTHSTFANTWSDGTRGTPSVLINDHYEDINGNLQIRPLEETRFLNCILWGNNAQLQDFDELVVDLEGDVNDLLIRGCAVDLDATGEADWIEESTLDATPPFADIFSRDFHLVSGNSEWNGVGVPAGLPFLATDLDGLPRVVGSAPDVGCYERQ